mgnify:CR=1 FL=1
MTTSNKVVGITLCIVCIFLTMGICVQIRTVESTNTIVLQNRAENDLRDEVLKWKEKYERAYETLEEKQKTLDTFRETTASKDATSSVINDELALNNNLLGVTNLKGPGLIITLKDDPNASRKNLGPIDDVSNHIIHDSDLRAVVNALKNAGAEAISINGQRVVFPTAINCVGNVIKVNQEKVGTPFEILAIGFPERMDNALTMPGGYLEILEEYGIVVTVKRSDEVKIPKYNGVITSNYIKNAD